MCQCMLYTTEFPFLLFPPVVPIIPVVIPLAVDLSDVSENDLVIQRPTPDNNGREL